MAFYVEAIHPMKILNVEKLATGLFGAGSRLSGFNPDQLWARDLLCLRVKSSENWSGFEKTIFVTYFSSLKSYGLYVPSHQLLVYVTHWWDCWASGQRMKLWESEICFGLFEKNEPASACPCMRIWAWWLRFLDFGFQSVPPGRKPEFNHFAAPAIG